MLVLQDKQEREARRAAKPKPMREDPFGNVLQGRTIVMTREESEQIEELLMVWYYWAKADKFQQGYDKHAPSCRMADRSDVHATQEDIDARIDTYDAEQVDVCINELPLMLRAAIGVHTANKAARATVFRNNRLTREEQHAKYQEAKTLLLPMLLRRQLVKIAA